MLSLLQEHNADPLCRRLELKDLVPTVMQRLTKYPLLIDSLLKNTTGANTLAYCLKQWCY
jgi:Rho guanine nucleotide exchange factor 12